VKHVFVVLTLAAGLLAGCNRNGRTFADIDPESGCIVRLYRGSDTIRFRTDEWSGPSFRDIDSNLTYSLSYNLNGNHPVCIARIENNTGRDISVNLRERLVLGVDSEMRTFPQWDSLVFPSVIRCEKQFAWGYFMSPTGKILTVATEEPVASYALNYEYEDILEWVWGHTVRTASLDLLHAGPLPERHPQDLDVIRAGESLEWHIHLGIVDDLCDVKPAVSRWAAVPMMELDRYTVERGEQVKVKTWGMSKPSIIITTPNGSIRTVRGHVISGLDEPGMYNVRCSFDGRYSEATLYVRESWEWYAEKAREFIAKYPPRMGNSCESYYGYLPAMLAAGRNPRPEIDSVIAGCLERDLGTMIDLQTGLPLPLRLPERIQNFSTLAVILARYYQAGADTTYLHLASRLADYVMSKQDSSGAYRSNGTHYTAVIYPAKSLLDVAIAEDGAGMSAEASRHRESAIRSCLDLADRLDDIETEGDLTFEDGMITCSALQMAYAALNTSDTQIRSHLTDAAEYMMRKHRCMEQRMGSDCRSRGATLRWWEALDVYFSPNQAMSSPHGWTAWKAYADAYLYRLTGKEEYRRDLLEVMGACVQLMDLSGEIRWAFVCDPYIAGRVCVPGSQPCSWTTVDKVVGEQYLPLINAWCRNSDGQAANFGEFGGSGDGTVYEIFNAVEELMLLSGQNL